MGAKYSRGQRVKIISVDEIPYGLKYSFLETTLGKTGVVQDYNAQSSKYIVRLDSDGGLISLSESSLENE